MSDPTAPSTYGVGQYVASEAHMAVLPRSWKAAGTKRCALVVPGWNGNALTIKTGLTNANESQLLALAGTPSFCGDYAGGQTWGNDTVQSRLSSMFTFAQSAYGVKNDKVLIWGGSMGTLSALNWARNNPTKVAAIAIELPAVDLNDAYTTHAAAITSYIGTDAVTNINSAYGGAGGYSSALPTHNPNTVANIATVGGQAIPTVLYYSTDDPLITPSVVTTYAAAINTAGGNCTAISMGACGGHAVSAALQSDPSPIVNWLAQYA